jgi:hypothetical protein
VPKPITAAVATFTGTLVSNQLPGTLLHIRVNAKLLNH